MAEIHFKRVVALVTTLFLTTLLPLMAQETLSNCMAKLQERYGIHFIYDAALQDTLSATRIKAVPAATLPLEEALRQTFEGTPVIWHLRGRNVILKTAVNAPVIKTRRVTLNGYISDAVSGETLIGAGVLSGQTGAATNEFGYYSLTLPAGRHQLKVAYIGYDPTSLELDLQRDTTLNFALQGNSELDAARIVARKDAGLQSAYLGSLEVPLTQIRNVPALFGEADVIKALQLLPGVQGGMEGFSGLYVRGGGPEENLILLDGVPVYNMDHMLGLFSIFQTDAVKNVTLYKGSFPARYGGRISSAVDIRTNDGNLKETHGSLTVGLLNDRFHLEGPIVKDKLSYSLSARGMHTIIAEPFMRLFLKDEHYNYFFYDLNGKLTWRATDKDRFYLSVYNGADNCDLDHKEHTENNPVGSEYYSCYDADSKMLFDWGSTVGALRWNHVFNGKLFSNTTLFATNYHTKAMLDSQEKSYFQGRTEEYSGSLSFRSGIRDFGLRSDFDWTPAPGHLVKFGADYTRHDFLPETSFFFEDGEETNLTPLSSDHYFGNEASLYAEDNISLGHHFSINPGLRLSWFNTQGRNYLSLQPRFSAKATLDGGVSLKAGYSRMAQYVHLLSSTVISLPFDLWVPITKDIPPVTADHYSLGVYYDGLPGWEFSVEGYWKNMYDLLEYKEGVVFLFSSEKWEQFVEAGRGRAYGLEFFIQKTSGKTTGWISYTLSRSFRWFPDGSINLGQPFPYKYDRPHAFNLTLNHKFSEKVDVSFSWVFSSGHNMTVAERQTTVITPGLQYGAACSSQPVGHIESRNNYRLPPTHRLNLGINLRHRTRRGNEAVWNFSIYNAYNALNPNFILVRNNQEWDSNTYQYKYKVTATKITFLPILPAFSYTYNF